MSNRRNWTEKCETVSYTAASNVLSPEKTGPNKSFHYHLFFLGLRSYTSLSKEAKRALFFFFSDLLPCLAHPWLLIILLADRTTSSVVLKLSQWLVMMRRNSLLRYNNIQTFPSLQTWYLKRHFLVSHSWRGWGEELSSTAYKILQSSTEILFMCFSLCICCDVLLVCKTFEAYTVGKNLKVFYLKHHFGPFLLL